MRFLNLFNGKTVKWGGIALALLAGIFVLRGASRVGYLAAVAVAIVSFARPQLWLWIEKFADHANWPPFVALGVALMFALHHGGWAAVLAGIGPLTAYDGMYFEQNY